MSDILDDLPLTPRVTRGVPRSATSKMLKAAWMRQNPTKGEATFGLILASLKIEQEFSSQAQVAGYILDFYHCGLKKDGMRCVPFCVEIDGTSHNGTRARAHDATRTRVLESMGIKVIRFTNKQVVAERHAVALAVMRMRTGDVK